MNGAQNKRRAEEQRTLSPRDVEVLLRTSAHLPNLPRGSIKRAIRLAARLPDGVRAYALRIIAGKLAHDFAIRFLLLLDSSIGTRTRATSSAFDLTKSRDVAALERALELWSDLPNNVRVRTVDDFERFVDITAGLQMMIEASPAEDYPTWTLDSASQYRSYLLEASLLPELALTAHAWHSMAGAHREYRETTFVLPYDPNREPERLSPRVVADSGTVTVAP